MVLESVRFAWRNCVLAGAFVSLEMFSLTRVFAGISIV